MRWFERLASVDGTRRRGASVSYLVAIAAVAIAVAARAAFGDVALGDPLIIFLPAVVLAAVIGGFGPGLAAALLGGIAAWSISVPARWSLTLASRHDALALLLYLLVALLVCLVVDALRAAVVRLGEERRRVAELDAALHSAQAARARELSDVNVRFAQSERSLAMLIDAVTDVAIFMLDADGLVASWNPGAERAKGYTAGEIIGRHFSQFYTAEDRERGEPERGLAVAARSGRYHAEGWRLRKDGSRFWASAVIQPIRDAQGRLIGFGKVTRDMTERRRLEDHLRQAQKMEALGQLTGGIAHDFNNLLTVIGGNLETAARRLEEGEGKIAPLVERGLAGVTRAERLTRQLLAFARRQPLEPKTIDANRLISALPDMLKRTLGPLVQTEMVMAAGLWRTRVDPHQLENAIINLAINARDAMPNGGKLTIETANASLDEAYAEAHNEVTPGQYVMVAVSDSGIGMAPDIADKAFDPFFTTKPVGQGSGLGLSQVYGFLKQSGGHVKIYSEIGRGTTVKMYLPRSLTVEEASRVAILPVHDLSAAGETILLVEDEPEVRRHTAGLLLELGYRVLEAEDAEVALALLGEAPEIRLLLTDVGLPRTDGRALADEVRRRRPMIKILFMTAYTRNAIVHHGVLDPGVLLLTKPFTFEGLAAQVKKALAAS